MLKRLVYIFLVLIFTSCLSFAKSICSHTSYFIEPANYRMDLTPLLTGVVDTSKTKALKIQEAEDKKKIKEIAKAKRQAKPEKLGESPPPVVDTVATKVKPKRQRRPEGLERPPEMPRRNN
jgi:hypothetical protein